jgi:hypothetical protein
MTKIEICEKPQVLTAQMNEDNDEPIAFFLSTNIQIDNSSNHRSIHYIK